jgi:hypothetical protein
MCRAPAVGRSNRNSTQSFFPFSSSPFFSFLPSTSADRTGGEQESIPTRAQPPPFCFYKCPLSSFHKEFILSSNNTAPDDSIDCDCLTHGGRLGNRNLAKVCEMRLIDVLLSNA